MAERPISDTPVRINPLPITSAVLNLTTWPLK
jgi:hypothetical protein